MSYGFDYSGGGFGFGGANGNKYLNEYNNNLFNQKGKSGNSGGEGGSSWTNYINEGLKLVKDLADLMNLLTNKTSNGAPGDIKNRLAAVSKWIVRDNLSGKWTKYVDPSFLSTLVNGGDVQGHTWNNTVQYYLATVQRTLNHSKVVFGDGVLIDYRTRVNKFIQKVNYADSLIKNNKNNNKNNNNNNTNNKQSFFGLSPIIIIGIASAGIVMIILNKK